VTTAELWRLKIGTTVEDIREADEIGSVAEPFDILVLLQPPDNLDSKNTRVAFEQMLTREQTSKLDQMFRNTRNEMLSSFIDHFSTYVPSLFIIISYKRVRSALTKLHNFFGQDFLVHARVPKTT
jgi:hypothetical protein